MKTAGPWSFEQVEAHLAGMVVPLRLSCLNGSGWPVVLSLWYLYRDGRLWCATSPTARVVRYLTADPRCGFEVSADSPPYRGVRGRALASVHAAQGEEVLRALIQRYLGTNRSRLAQWLLSRGANEVAFCLTPVALSSWDYARRMAP